MEYKRSGNDILVRIDKGEEILEKMMEVAAAEQITLASVSALGAIDEFEVGMFSVPEKKYYSNVHTGDHEIVSLTGTLSTMEGQPYAHIHLAAADRSNSVFGGHMNRAMVSATCEMVLHVIEGSVDRAYSGEVGLNLLKFD